MGRISRHSSVFFAGTLFAAGAGYLFKVYLARVLGPEALGLYALGMTIVGFLGVFNALGLPQAAVRFVAVYVAKAEYANLNGFFVRSVAILLGLNFVLGLAVVWIGPYIALHLYHAPALVPYLWFFAAIMLFGCLSGFWGQVLSGFKAVAQRTIILNFIGTPLVIVLSMLLISAGHGLYGYLLAQVLSSVFLLGLFFVSAWKLTPPAARHVQRPLPKLPPEAVAFSASIFAIEFLTFVHGHADKVFIGTFLTVQDVGVYSVAAAIVAYVAILINSVNQIFSPTIADLHARGDHQTLGRLFQTLTKWVIGLTLPSAVVIMLFARPIMGIFGARFVAGWPILVIGTLGQLVNCGVGSVGLLLLMSGNQNRLLRVQIGMAIVAIALNFMLIPKFGLIGAALSAAITNAGTNLWNLLEVRSTLRLSPYNRSYLRLLLPVLASAAVILGARYGTFDMKKQWVAIVLAALAGYVVFIITALLAGLNDDDRLIIRAVSSKLLGSG
jgi:O-antigen/teichoic acid export membrane protein